MVRIINYLRTIKVVLRSYEESGEYIERLMMLRPRYGRCFAPPRSSQFLTHTPASRTVEETMSKSVF